MTRVLQIKKGSFRRVGIVGEPHVRLLDGCSSIYVLAQIAIDVPKKPSEVAHQRRQSDKLDYELRVEKSKPGIVKVVPLG